MAILWVGALVVLGACVALWRHQVHFQAQQEDDPPEHQLRFAWWQYHRRAFTTTLIGVLGLLLVVTEIADQRWVVLGALLGVGAILMVLPLLALWDYFATQRYYRQHDQGVRRATHELLAELKAIERRLQTRRRERGAAEDSEAKDPSGSAKEPTDPPAEPRTSENSDPP